MRLVSRSFFTPIPVPQSMLQHLSRLALLTVAVAALALTGCDSGDSAPSLGGTYTAASVEDGVPVMMTMEIDETNGGSFDVTGNVSGSDSGVTVSFDFDGTGTYDFPDVTMTLTLDVPDTDSTTLTGTVSASGDLLTVEDDEGTTLTLTRQ